MTATTPPFNTVAWFQVSTDDPATAQAFYGELFGWRVTGEPDAYQTISYAGSAAPSGGLANEAAGFPKGAIFCVLVADVAAAATKAEEQGGKILVPPTTTPDGLRYAELTDPAGNHFGVFTPAG